jgi:hypothetical protein
VTKTIAKGDALFEKASASRTGRPPAPISGIHQVSVRAFAIASIVTAVPWTLSTGLVAISWVAP